MKRSNLVLVIKELKKAIQESKSNGLFDLEKLCSNDFASLKTGTKEIKRIEEFKGLNIEDLPSSFAADEELLTVIYHFVLIEEQKNFLNYELDLSHKLGFKLACYPNADKTINDEVIEDAVKMEDLFDALNALVIEPKIDNKLSISTKSLTKSQLEIFKLVKKGYSVSMIASKLHKDKGNVSRAIKNIYRILKEDNIL